MKTFVKSIVGLAALTIGAAAMAQAEPVNLGIVSVNYNAPAVQAQTDAAIKGPSSFCVETCR